MILIRGPHDPHPNAVEHVVDSLVKNMRGGVRISVAPASIYRCWLRRYGGWVHSTFESLTPLRYPKSITTFHDVVRLRMPEMFKYQGRLVEWQYGVIYRNLQRYGHVVTHTQFQVHEVKDLLGIDAHYTPLGVDHDLFNQRMPRDAACSKLGLDPDARYLSVVSSNVPTKNLQLVQRIAEMLPEDARIIRAGSREPLQGRGIINFTALPPEDLVALYRASHGFLHPSLYEGFGLVIVEACACGIPIVAFNNTTQPELTRDGLVGDEEAFVERALSLLDHPPRLNARGIEDAERFTWKKTADGYMKIYAECIKGEWNRG